MHVAILDEELPYPTNSGKRIRSFNLAARLAQRHRVSYICHRNINEEEAREAAEYFRSIGIQPVVASHTAPHQSVLARSPRFYARLAGNLFSADPYIVQVHNGRAIRDLVSRFAGENDVDLWHCEWTPYAETLKKLDIRPYVVTAHNVESLIWRRYFATERNPLKRWYIGHQYRKLQRFEKRVFQEANRLVTVSQDDADLAIREFGASQVSVVENGVDVSYFSDQSNGNGRDASILFLGSLDWRPNLDGISVMLEQVLPRVLTEVPDATLEIVGRKPPRWLVDLAARTPNVRLHADVPDVRPFLRTSAVMAVPLRIGGGSRLKILEAAAARLPVVSTQVGAEGLILAPDQHLIEVESVEQMADGILHCLRQPQQASAMASRARQLIQEHYDWSILADKLEQVWSDCSTGSSATPCHVG